MFNTIVQLAQILPLESGNWYEYKEVELPEYIYEEF